MAENGLRPGAEWNRVRLEAAHAVKDLLGLLETDGSAQDLFDSYQRAKAISAHAMQARMRMHLPERCGTFHQLRDRLHEEITKRYGDTLPHKYLRVPYGSRTHEELFSVLLDYRGRTVPSALLRIVTADSVHTERRTRELRELGLDIDASKANDTDVYTLRSLEIDEAKIPSIVKNNVEKDRKVLPTAERERYLTLLQR